MKKTVFAGILFSGLVMPASAETINEALQQCGQEQNSLKRLVCYDRIVQNLSKYSGMDELMAVPAPLPARNDSISPSAPAVAQPRPRVVTPEDDFGMEYKSRQGEQKDKIYAQVASVDEAGRNKLVVTLDNEQVWQQSDGQSFRVKQGDKVYIERGALGAFYLSKDDINRRIRVKRIK